MKILQPKRSKKGKSHRDNNEQVQGFVPPPVQPNPRLLPLLGSTPPIATEPITPSPMPPIVAKVIKSE